MEGGDVYLKQIKTVVSPAKGFNIIATANTKGQGDNTGKFVGAGFLNESFLERFPITMEQDYPSRDIEREILVKFLKLNNVENERFVEALINWAGSLRKSFSQAIINDVISTRRLVHILKTYLLFKSEVRAVELGVSRFDEKHKSEFLEHFKNYFATDELDTEVVDDTEKEIKKMEFFEKTVDMDLEEFDRA